MGLGGQPHGPAALPTGNTRFPFVQEAGWTPWPVWTGVENLAATEIRSPDRPARSESLYRLSYPRQTHAVEDSIKIRQMSQNFWGTSQAITDILISLTA